MYRVLSCIRTKNWVCAEIEVLEGGYLLTPIVANRCAQLVHRLGRPAATIDTHCVRGTLCESTSGSTPRAGSALVTSTVSGETVVRALPSTQQQGGFEDWVSPVRVISESRASLIRRAPICYRE